MLIRFIVTLGTCGHEGFSVCSLPNVAEHIHDHMSLYIQFHLIIDRKTLVTYDNGPICNDIPSRVSKRTCIPLFCDA